MAGSERDSCMRMILHEFYYKEITLKSMVIARSALPWVCKRTILTQEVLRIFLNSSKKLPWESCESCQPHDASPVLRL